MIAYDPTILGLGNLVVRDRERPQLESYAAALAGEGHTVAGVASSWIRRGEVVVRRMGRVVVV